MLFWPLTVGNDRLKVVILGLFVQKLVIQMIKSEFYKKLKNWENNINKIFL